MREGVAERRRRRQQAEHRIGRFEPDRARPFGTERHLRGDAVDEPLKILVKVEHGIERRPNLPDLGRHLCHPVGSRNDDRTDCENRQREENDHAEAGGEPRRHAAPLEPFQQGNKGDRDY
jgi:hypothetical protein